MDFMKKAKDMKAKADKTDMDEKAMAKMKEMMGKKKDHQDHPDTQSQQ